MPSLYERLGGESALMVLVVSLYERVMADELTRPFFAHLDIEARQCPLPSLAPQTCLLAIASASLFSCEVSRSTSSGACG